MWAVAVAGSVLSWESLLSVVIEVLRCSFCANANAPIAAAAPDAADAADAGRGGVVFALAVVAGAAVLGRGPGVVPYTLAAALVRASSPTTFFFVDDAATSFAASFSVTLREVRGAVPRAWRQRPASGRSVA